jgi:hypothetical protein
MMRFLCAPKGEVIQRMTRCNPAAGTARLFGFTRGGYGLRLTQSKGDVCKAVPDSHLVAGGKNSRPGWAVGFAREVALN